MIPANLAGASRAGKRPTLCTLLSHGGGTLLRRRFVTHVTMHAHKTAACGCMPVHEDAPYGMCTPGP